jgi:phosphatidylglycerol:prolipoprotein diacylglycerol transferase
VHPYLIDFGFFKLPTYGLLFAGGVLIAWLWFTRRARLMQLPEDKVFNLAFYSLLGGIIGAKLLLVIVDWRDFVADPKLLLGTLRTAGVLVGGVVGGAVVFIAYARRHRLPILRLADAIVAPLALAQALGRFGCFAAGCCYGEPVSPDHPLGVVFDNPDSIAHASHAGETLIAVQPLEATIDLVIVALLTLLWRRRPKPEGTVLWCYLLLYGIARFTIEFWRGDRGRGLYFNDLISTSQLFAIAGIAIGFVMLVRSRLARRS